MNTGSTYNVLVRGYVGEEEDQSKDLYKLVSEPGSKIRRSRRLDQDPQTIDFGMTTHKIKVKMSMFDGTGDFGIWKKRMLANLSVQGLKDVLTPQVKEDSKTVKDDKGAEDDEDSKDKKIQDEIARKERDEKAVNLIFMSVGDHILQKLDKCTSAAET